MSELLIEIFSEEIPAGLQQEAGKKFANFFTEKAEEIIGKEYDLGPKYFVGPRRLTLLVENLPSHITKQSVEVKGPKTSAPDKAIEGFLKKYELTSEKELEVKEIAGTEYYFYSSKEEKVEISSSIPNILTEALQKLAKAWPKTMRWGSYQMRWIRPMHNILILLDGKVIDFQFGHINANNKTYGHRQLGIGELTIQNFQDYQEKLRSNGVIISVNERKEIIKTALGQKAAELGCQLIEDDQLLNEVAGLVEYPNVMAGHFATEFMHLPEDVLITVMKKHQRYFAVRHHDGRLAPHFLFVSNSKGKNDAKIALGNEKVLTARLDDGAFFYKSDNYIKLEERVKLLEQVTFHKEIGNLHEKTQNIVSLAKLIAMWVPHSDILEVELAANLCKTDLTTDMVSEFPELQGVIGSHYAKAQGYSYNVATAIKEHYKPFALGQELPENPVSICVSLADKLDNLVSLFAAGEKPTGSKDPYAMRRQAIGIIRIILEKQIDFPFRLALEKAVIPYTSLAKAKYKKGLIDIFTDHTKLLTDEILDFVFERFRIMLKDQGIKSEFIDAIYNQGQIDDLLIIKHHSEILQKKQSDARMQEIIAAYKRAYNIFSKAEQEDGKSYLGKKPHKLGFKNEAEKKLYKICKLIKHDSQSILKEQGFAAALDHLEIIISAINDFFQDVKVNDEDESIRENRLKLLAYLCDNVNKLANFSHLES